MSSTIKQEQRILGALVANLGAAGFLPAAVWIEGDGEYVMALPDGTVEECEGEPPTEILRALTIDELLKVFADYDLYAPTVHFTDQHATTWGQRGVMVVPGNGSDFIADWHCGNAAFNAIVDEVATAACDEVYA